MVKNIVKTWKKVRAMKIQVNVLLYRCVQIKIEISSFNQSDLKLSLLKITTSGKNGIFSNKKNKNTSL